MAVLLTNPQNCVALPGQRDEQPVLTTRPNWDSRTVLKSAKQLVACVGWCALCGLRGQGCEHGRSALARTARRGAWAWGPTDRIQKPAHLLPSLSQQFEPHKARPPGCQKPCSRLQQPSPRTSGSAHEGAITRSASSTWLGTLTMRTQLGRCTEDAGHCVSRSMHR